jgi:hypothetical protein
MKKQSYFELLKDPRWQKKRLEIMQRDGFKCRKCGANQLTLNVHHVIYAYGVEPWKYPDMAFLTLCEPCHDGENTQNAKVLTCYLHDIGLFADDLVRLAGAIGRDKERAKRIIKAVIRE